MPRCNQTDCTWNRATAEGSSPRREDIGGIQRDAKRTWPASAGALQLLCVQQLFAVCTNSLEKWQRLATRFTSKKCPTVCFFRAFLEAHTGAPEKVQQYQQLYAYLPGSA